MRLPAFLVSPLRRLLGRLADGRPYDIAIGGHADPYLLRWHVIPRNRFLNIYLHRFLRSDEDRALHDHPWLLNCSLLLEGRYAEHAPSGVALRRAGDLALRLGPALHRIALVDGDPVWTLFVTGPKVREWGFDCPNGWRHWREFTAEAPGESRVGRGCG